MQAVLKFHKKFKIWLDWNFLEMSSADCKFPNYIIKQPMVQSQK